MRLNKEQRDEVRREIATLQATFPPKRVPERVFAGDSIAAVEWKAAVAKPPYHINSQPGDSCSGRELIEIRDRLATYLNTINH